MDKLSHFDQDGNSRMVDVSEKNETKRTARARGRIYMSQELIKRISDKTVEKGDVLGVAQVAGIMATKKTSDMIPMCHPLMITGVDLSFKVNEDSIDAFCQVKCKGQTGVEMEALQGVSTALLTIYDMCKAIDKSMTISDIYLEYKDGGKSGEYKRVT